MSWVEFLLPHLIQRSFASEPYGRNDRIRILAGAFRLLGSRPGSIEAVIRQADIRYLDRLASRLDSGDAMNEDEVGMLEGGLTR